MEATPSIGRGAAPSRPARSPLLSRYLLRLLVRPLVATLIIVLPALLLERLLRLFDLLAETGTVSPVVQLLLYLTPHYVGLALPAAFFISIFSVITNISEHQELDAMQSIGLSITRLARPFLLVGAAMVLVGIGLFGYLQPLGRYQYRAGLDAVVHAGWNATIVPGEFIRIGRQLEFMVDGVDRRDGSLSGIFIEQRRPDGTSITTTAPSGHLVTQDGVSQIVLDLEGGSQITVQPDGAVRSLRFGESSTTRHFTVVLATFRPRGDDEREMTLDELWRGEPARPTDGVAVPQRRLVSELHGRLVRSFSMLLLPLLAIPIGLGAKRTRRWHGAAFSALVLMLYHHAVQLGESLGDLGVVDPRPVLWGVFLLFAAFCVLSFRRAQRHPHEGPFDAAFDGMERAGAAILARLPRRRKGAAKVPAR